MTKHIIICFGGRCRIIALPSSYNGLLKVARKQFPNMGSLYSLVALYQPEDFKATNDRTCWVELDETAYSALHDRAVLYFNVQHATTKEYILPLPNSDPDTQLKPQVPPFEEVTLSQLASLSSTTCSIITDEGKIKETRGGHKNTRDDGDACASGWGGASERFRRSAKYIPNLQECKEAVRRGSGQLVEPENNEHNIAEQMSLGTQRRYQDLDVCPSDCDHDCQCVRCQGAKTTDDFPLTKQTVLSCSNDVDNDVITYIHEENHGEDQKIGSDDGWNAHNLAACTSQDNTLNTTNAWEAGRAAGYAVSVPRALMEYGDKDMGNHFDQSTAVRGCVPDPVLGCWGAPPNFTPPMPPNHIHNYGHRAVGPSFQHHQPHGITWSSRQPEDLGIRQYDNFGDDTHAPATERTHSGSIACELVHPHPATFPEVSSFVPTPHNGWSKYVNERIPASTWSPERQSQKQYCPSEQQQSKEYEPSFHAAKINNGSPIRCGRTKQRSSRYWNSRNSQTAKANMTYNSVPSVDGMHKQQEANYEGFASISDHNRTGTDSNATITDCERRRQHDKFIGHNSSGAFHAARSSPGDWADDSTDIFWNKPPRSQKQEWGKGWGRPVVDKAAQRFMGDSSFTEKGTKPVDVGKHRQKRYSWGHSPIRKHEEGPVLRDGAEKKGKGKEKVQACFGPDWN